MLNQQRPDPRPRPFPTKLVFGDCSIWRQAEHGQVLLDADGQLDEESFFERETFPGRLVAVAVCCSRKAGSPYDGTASAPCITRWS
jgi:hypothetical protein